MPVVKLGISFPEELIEEINNLSKNLKKSRSEIIRDAVVKVISDYKKQKTIEKVEKIYREISEDDKRLAEDFLSICSEPIAQYKTLRRGKKK